jgi:hypothetical protein
MWSHTSLAIIITIPIASDTRDDGGRMSSSVRSDVQSI